MNRARLLRRLSGRSDDLLDDVRRLLAIRRGETPARPDLGLPLQPAWLPDAEARRSTQEAIATSLRAGEPRLAEVAVQDDAASARARFTIRAQRDDGSVLGANATVDATGGWEIAR